jgi:hexosaminidase
MKKPLFILMFTLGYFFYGFAQVIPYANSYIEEAGELKIQGQLSYNVDPFFKTEISHFKNYLKDDFYLNMLPSTAATLKVKRVLGLGPEAYKIKVSSQNINIEASTTAACFYAFQTLRQLIKLNGKGYYVIKNCSIEDKPAYVWRSHLLDEGRFFLGKVYVKKTLDQMALLKMNVLQWHLTEDQGWRIEIKKYPLLTQKGSTRDSTLRRAVRWQPEREKWGWFNTSYDGTPHGGFYTQNDIKEIVKYAAERHITVVPEIEMPGHSSAAAVAYPWLAAGNVPERVPCEFGVKENAFNVANPKVYQFLQDVLTEVMALFPSKVIHIGGDEVRFGAWKNNKAIQELMKKESLHSYADVQIYFTNKISAFISSKGRKMMGWNEILGSEHQEKDVNPAVGVLAPGTIVQYWKGTDSLYAATLRKGYSTVYSENKKTYLCFPAEWLGIDVVYNASLIPAGLEDEYKKNILGINSSMWTEIIYKFEEVDRLTYPRLAAIAELGWTEASNKDLKRFKNTLIPLKKYWDSKGVLCGVE